MQEWLSQEEGFETIDRLGASRRPFLFVISFDKSKLFAQPLDRLDEQIYYKLEGWRNDTPNGATPPTHLTTTPYAFASYEKRLLRVLHEIRQGNTYLLNLTFKTPIETTLSLHEIFTHAKAKFKLYFKDQFICFSPERFVEIEGETIATYPMKGTIDASLPDAKARILADSKEMAEHVMIVDLMRNDLGIVGHRVRVERFRYVEEIEAGRKRLLQVSSKVTAQLPDDWRDGIGRLLSQILPAGSITGTPKRRTVEIIEELEPSKRGFYTGVFGVFDGESLRSSVMIRFIQKQGEQLYYHSGGGITLDSDPLREYQELQDKIYLPL